MNELERQMFQAQKEVIKNQSDFIALIKNPPIKVVSKRQRRKLTLKERFTGWVEETLTADWE